MGYLSSVFSHFLLKLANPAWNSCPQLMSIGTATFPCGSSSSVAGTILSSSTKFANPKPVDQTKQKNTKLIGSVYRDGTPFFTI